MTDSAGALETHAENRRSSEASDDEDLRGAFRGSVEEGVVRLQRSWPGLLTTGLVGGIDLGVGVAAMAIVEAATGSHLLGALAFTSGFIALTLARSELFTENFLVPVAAVVAYRCTVADLLRLWIGTFVMNLLGGWLIAVAIVSALPDVRSTLLELGTHYPEMGLGWQAFAAGILGGAVVTLMTWMQRNTEEIGRIVAAITMSFLLAAGPLNHVIVSSVEMFAALQVGASFGYIDWAGATLWATMANLIGGLAFVTLLRFIQVGAVEISERRQDSQPPERSQFDRRRG